MTHWQIFIGYNQFFHHSQRIISVLEKMAAYFDNEHTYDH